MAEIGHEYKRAEETLDETAERAVLRLLNSPAVRESFPKTVIRELERHDVTSRFNMEIIETLLEGAKAEMTYTYFSDQTQGIVINVHEKRVFTHIKGSDGGIIKDQTYPSGRYYSGSQVNNRRN